MPQTAESCQLGESAYFSIAAGAFLLVGLLLVCLKVLHERELDPHFGVMGPDDYGPDEDDPNEDTDEHEHSDNYEDFDDVIEEYHSPTTSAARQESFASMEEGGGDGAATKGGLDPLLSDDDTSDKLTRENSASSVEKPSKTTTTTPDNGDGEEDEANQASESRWTTLANMEASQKQENSLGSRLLEQLVNDLNCTYQTTDKMDD